MVAWLLVSGTALTERDGWAPKAVIFSPLVLALGLDPHGDYFKVLALVAFLPTAANGVVIATELKAAPYKIAGAIAASTLVSLVLLNFDAHLKFIDFLSGFSAP